MMANTTFFIFFVVIFAAVLLDELELLPAVTGRHNITGDAPSFSSLQQVSPEY